MEPPKKSILQQFDGMLLPPFTVLLEDAKGRFEAIRDLDTRDDDVILVAYPKAGTHWTWEVLNMLVQGTAEYNKSTKVSVFMEAIPDLNVLDKVDSPRVLNTHAPLRWLPKKHLKNGRRLVHVIRNPKDVLVSAYHHMKSSGEFGPIGEELRWEDFFEMHVKPGYKLYGGWFAYEKEIEATKRNADVKSIHTLHYEDMKRDPETEIRRLGDYLQVEYTEQLVKDIADKTSFKKLKEATKTVKKPPQREFKNSAQEKYADILSNVKPPIIYRKGEIGDWKNYFTVAQNEKFDALYEEEMKDSDIKLTFV